MHQCRLMNWKTKPRGRLNLRSGAMIAGASCEGRCVSRGRNPVPADFPLFSHPLTSEGTRELGFPIGLSGKSIAEASGVHFSQLYNFSKSGGLVGDWGTSNQGALAK